MPSLRVPFLQFMLILFANHAVSLHGINLSVIIVRGNRIMIFEVVLVCNQAVVVIIFILNFIYLEVKFKINRLGDIDAMTYD